MKWNNSKTGKIELAYTKEFLNRNAQLKWQRIQGIESGSIDLIKGKALSLLKDDKSNERQKDAAAIIFIIASTGLRPGDRKHFEDSGNRGVSTLSKDNIKISGNKVSFNFIGKSFQENTASVDNKILADYLKNKTKDKKGDDFIFDATRADTIVAFRLKLGFKDLKLKDMRTYVATDEARKLLFEDETPPPPLPDNKKDIKKVIQSKLTNVFEKVSQKLNNTPAMAKNAYVHPVIIDTYLTKLGLNRSMIEKAEDDKKFDLSLDEIIRLNKDRFKIPSKINISEEEEEYVDFYNLPKWWD